MEKLSHSSFFVWSQEIYQLQLKLQAPCKAANGLLTIPPKMLKRTAMTGGSHTDTLSASLSLSGYYIPPLSATRLKTTITRVLLIFQHWTNMIIFINFKIVKTCQGDCKWCPNLSKARAKRLRTEHLYSSRIFYLINSKRSKRMSYHGSSRRHVLPQLPRQMSIHPNTNSHKHDHTCLYVCWTLIFTNKKYEGTIEEPIYNIDTHVLNDIRQPLRWDSLKQNKHGISLGQRILSWSHYCIHTTRPKHHIFVRKKKKHNGVQPGKRHVFDCHFFDGTDPFLHPVAKHLYHM